MDYLINIDSDLLLWLNGAHNAFFDAFMMLFTNKFIWVPMYLALAYLLFRNMSLKQVVMCLVAIALLIVITDQMSSSLIRYAVGRLRPANLENPISDMVHIVDGYRGGRYGFPSSHAANSFGLAFFLLYLFRRSPIPVFIMVWAIFNSYTRIYLGVHYPGDLFVGMIVGFVGATMCYYVFRHFTGHQPQGDVRQLYIPLSIGMITIVVIALVSIVFRL